MKNPTIDEMFDEFKINVEDYNSHDEALIALNEEVASWIESEYNAHGDDVLEIIKEYGVSETYHGFVNESICKGMYDSISDFWINYQLDWDSELERAMDIVTSSGFHFPEVDELCVEQDFTIYTNGTVIEAYWD